MPRGATPVDIHAAMNTLYVMDPLASLNLAGDSTVMLMRESTLRGYPAAWCTPSDLYAREGKQGGAWMDDAIKAGAQVKAALNQKTHLASQIGAAAVIRTSASRLLDAAPNDRTRRRSWTRQRRPPRPTSA